jgi:alpha-ketoglutarate-dependent taurine dioxygenase
VVSAASPEISAPREGYRAWRDRKIARYPRSAAELIVEVRDPRRLSATERAAILERVARANMAVYASGCGGEPDREIARALGRQFGLGRLDPNFLADDDGISSIRVSDGADRGEFIPYTSRPIRWHTDGYYNPPERGIRAFILHCAHAAAEGGETQLLDHEIAWLLLNDADPAWARALTRPGAMTIPARDSGRVAQPGPVFSFDSSGKLHMRYTARTVSIEWAQDQDTAAAVRFLAQWLSDDAPFALGVRLQPGMGVICNNVLHTRSAFRDDPDHPRLLYRARYYDRIRA